MLELQQSALTGSSLVVLTLGIVDLQAEACSAYLTAAYLSSMQGYWEIVAGLILSILGISSGCYPPKTSEM